MFRFSSRGGRGVITHFFSLSAAGFAATAISYGPARMGFGLFVPEFRDALSMSTSTVGFVSSLGFLGFLLSLLVAQALLLRKGPAVPVLTGLAAATTGMVIVAAASNVWMLALGVFLAACSAGFAWTPFNDAVHRKIRLVNRPTALSEISTGTSIGIVAAGFTALVMVLTGFSWRYCWTVFAASGALVLAGNWAALRSVEKSPDSAPAGRWTDILQGKALPLFLVGFVLGTTSAIYISFAGDRVRESGGVPGMSAAAAPALVYIFYGICGLMGLLTSRAKEALGLEWLLRLLMGAGAVSLLLIAFFPGGWAGLTLSAGLQGVHVMMTSAVLAFWSERLFPSLPSLSFTAVLLATAAGSVFGPALFGVTSDAFGPASAFLGAAVLPAAMALLLRARHATESPLLEEG